MTLDKREKIEQTYSPEEIQAKVREMGAKISKDYAGKNLHLIGILKGSVIFMADLARAIDLPVTMDFISVSSYGDKTESSGVVRLTLDLSSPIEGKNVLIVEDIVDTGITLEYLIENLKTRMPADVKVCSFLSKPSRRKTAVEPDYVGFEIPDYFVVGYGLDYAQRFRNLPYVGKVVAEE